MIEPDEWYKKFNEESELELGRIDGLVPFFILVFRGKMEASK